MDGHGFICAATAPARILALSEGRGWSRPSGPGEGVPRVSNFQFLFSAFLPSHRVRGLLPARDSDRVRKAHAAMRSKSRGPFTRLRAGSSEQVRATQLRRGFFSNSPPR